MGALADRIAHRRGGDRVTRSTVTVPAGPWKPEPVIPQWVIRAQERRLPAKENVA